MPREINSYRSHGTGRFAPEQFRALGRNVVFEEGVLVFHPENISLGSNIYVGHQTILKGYYQNEMMIGDNTWIGQGCFFHSAGGLRIGQNVGIGPHVKIITSRHEEEGLHVPILFSRIEMGQVVIEDDCDLGIGSMVLPGVTIGRGSQVGAGAVVTKNVEPYSIVAGVPARLLKKRGEIGPDEPHATGKSEK
ncbi:MAG TPA: DapH/DapD/GlmU-related protein [Pyrinomonadaceae bacterium]|jgi:acetyltransferase-like isoleucine patch superfamily enzyme|nr:DapH/DapD/GlmU-related protein [Pyrinomonadaceae bacterium]